MDPTSASSFWGPASDSPMPRRSAFLLALGLTVAAATTLFACSQGPDVSPPDGWEAVSETQWVRTGAEVDPAVAFRDLETLEAMGVTLSDDVQTRYGQEQMLALYRTSPEIIDSLFVTYAEPILNRRYPAEGYEDAVLDAVEEAKRVILGGRDHDSKYRNTTALPDPPPLAVVYPDSLRDRGVGGTVAVQVYVSDEGQPQTVMLVESLHPMLDAMVMRQAATTRFNPAWVVEPGRGGEVVPNFARIAPTFDPERSPRR